MHRFEKNIRFFSNLFNRSMANEAVIVRLYIKYKKLIFRDNIVGLIMNLSLWMKH